MKAEIPKFDFAAFSWFVSRLNEDVGRVEWVRMTKEEQIKHDAKSSYNKGYPFKVIQYPIPKGKTIILEDSKKLEIKCDSEETRNLIFQLAFEYARVEKELRYFKSELNSIPWHKVEELPPHSPMAAFTERGRIFLVYSPALAYVTGSPVFGFRDGTKWFVILNGAEIEHAVTHYRMIPPAPVEATAEYKDIKEEVMRLQDFVDKHEEENDDC